MGKLRAFRVTIRTWPGLESIYVDETRQLAMTKARKESKESGYDVPWCEFRSVRAREFDEFITADTKAGACIGWKDSSGANHGCMREPQESMRHLVGVALLREGVRLKLSENADSAVLTGVAGVTYDPQPDAFTIKARNGETFTIESARDVARKLKELAG